MKTLQLVKVFLFTLIIGFISCSKDKTEPIPDKEVTKKIDLDKITGVPGDIIKLKSSFTLDKNSWNVKFGEHVAVVNKLSDSISVLRIPYLPVGTYNLDLSAMGVADKKVITISTYQPVDDPEAVVTKIEDDINAAIAIAQNLSGKEYVEVLQGLEQTFKTEYNKLSTSEKKEVGYQLWILLNSIETDTSPAMNSPSLFKTQSNMRFGVSNTSSNGDDIVAEALKFGQYTSAAVALLVAGADVTATFPDLSSKVIGIGVLAAGVAVLVKALDQAELVFSMVNRHKAFNELSISKFGFTPEIDLSFSITSTYQSLSITDKLTNNQLIKGIFENIDRLESTYTKLANLTNKVASWFSSTPALPPFDDYIPNQPITETRATPASQLSIENISDPRIKLAINGEGNQVVITPTDIDLNTEIIFTFDLVYKDDKLDISNRKTFTATYNGAREVKWVDSMIPGDWIGHDGSRQGFAHLKSNFTASFTKRIDEYGMVEILDPPLMRTWKLEYKGEYIIIFQDPVDMHYEEYRIIKKGELGFIRWYF